MTESTATIDQRESDRLVTWEVIQDGRLKELVTVQTDDKDEMRMQLVRLINRHCVQACITHFINH